MMFSEQKTTVKRNVFLMERKLCYTDASLARQASDSRMKSHPYAAYSSQCSPSIFFNTHCEKFVKSTVIHCVCAQEITVY